MLLCKTRRVDVKAMQFLSLRTETLLLFLVKFQCTNGYYISVQSKIFGECQFGEKTPVHFVSSFRKETQTSRLGRRNPRRVSLVTRTRLHCFGSIVSGQLSP